MTSQSLGEPLTLRHTNVSNPSFVHSKPSQQSITASEDYYSFSGSGGSDDTIRVSSPSNSTTSRVGGVLGLTQTRSQTPPERYRTPFQSSTQLPQSSYNNLRTAGAAQDVIGNGGSDEEVRKTPMRGEGKRRSSHSYPSDTEAGAATGAAAVPPLREGGIRRKPVPSTVMETLTPPDVSPMSSEYIDPNRARSSVLGDIEREQGGASPGQDDTPYIRFAIDQLTRDEDVKGSRVYPDGRTYDAALWQQQEQHTISPISSVRMIPQDEEVDEHDRSDHRGLEAAGAGVAGAGALAALGFAAHNHNRQEDEQAQRPVTQWPASERPYDERAQLPPNAPAPRRSDEPNIFIPVSNEEHHYESLNFIPGILRPLWLILFLLFLLTLMALLILCAIWSLTHRGIFDYGFFGDSKYFIFEYLPTLLGMLLFFWLIQIEVAVYRIAPFIAMASETSERSREEGALLPMTPKTFFLPSFAHFRAKQPVVGIFLLVSWLQIFSIPLLASSFNVRSVDQGAASTWRWIATAEGIWPVIALYMFLLIATVMLFFWLMAQRRRTTGTGLKWDPRSLADLIVLLERSNALSLTEDEELRLQAPTLGYWRTSRSGNEVLHSYGVAGKSARQYSLENGRIREKVSTPLEPKSRFSDFEDDREMGREQRHSREKMLPKQPSHPVDDEAGSRVGGRAVPWFLKPSAALLWIVIAFVLLLAFLLVSYLPQTKLSNGFAPLVPAVVSKVGFSGTNFLYSFVPALLAMICFLGLLDIDYAYRRLQPYTSLLAEDGELAEKSLLLSYTAQLPGFVTGSAVANGHWRVAFLSLSSFIAIALPVLGGGVFWAQFFVPKQSISIFTHMPGYYALTAFVVLYALAIMTCVFPSRALRNLDRQMPRGNRARSFRDVLRIVRMSRMLDDVAFHSVTSKTDLITRLLSTAPGGTVPGRYRQDQRQEHGTSKVSLADSVRGFGHARQQANIEDGTGKIPRYALGRYMGRDGREYAGVDRLRS